MRLYGNDSVGGSLIRGAAAAVLALALLMSLAVTAVPAEAALSGSIVFIRDHNVWIMAADDPQSARQVTDDGTAESPYTAPVQSADGVIYAVTAGGFGNVVRLNQEGQALGAPFRPQSLDQIDDLDLSPDGRMLAVTSLESVQSPLGFLFAFFLDIAYADGRDSTALPHNIDLPYAGWYSNSALAGSQYVEQQFDISGLSTFGLDDTEPEPWHDTCRAADDPFGPGGAFPEGCDMVDQPDFTPDLERMATIGQPVETLGEPSRVIVWDMAGAPPAAPEKSCTHEAELGVGRFDRPSWSPDGDGIVWAFSSEITGEEPAGAGVYLAEGFASGTCEAAFANTRLVAPGGSWPDWSAAALGETPQPTATACANRAVPRPAFTDTAGNVHEAAIHCVVWHGVAQGTSATTYSPRNGVTRAQMASFTARTIEAAGAQLPPGQDQFNDVDGNTHENNIERLAAAGIVQGVGEGRYAPGATVTRAQMASFLARTFEFVHGQPLPVADTAFTDIAGNTHEDNIRRVAGAGFAQGTTATTYSPANDVRRDQMASFLARMLERFAADGRITPPG